MMENLLILVGKGVPMWIGGLVTPVMLGMALAEEEKPLVEVHDVTVEKVKENVFRVTAKGIVPTSGWVVNLHPAVYVKPPEVWEFWAVGIEPTGIVPQVLASWVAPVEMSLSEETLQVVVKGSNQIITAPVPW